MAGERVVALDALRSIAIAGVVLVHSNQLVQSRGILSSFAQAGQYGVQLFFFISAITVTLSYEQHQSKWGNGARARNAWLLKRVLRIAPLYYVGIIVYQIEFWALSASEPTYSSHVTLFQVVANIFFFHTWVPSANNTVVPGGWSIGAEMFFYTLVPFLWLTPSTASRATLSTALAAFCLLITVVLNKIYFGTFNVSNNSYLYLWYPAQALVFAAGVIYIQCRPSLLSKIVLVFPMGIGLLLLAIELGTYAEIFPVASPVLIGAASAAMLYSLTGAFEYAVKFKAIRLIGEMSYGIYIFHFAILDVERLAIIKLHLTSVPLLPVFAFALSDR